jgi:hypothetical protein
MNQSEIPRENSMAANNTTMHNTLQTNPDGSKNYQAVMCLIIQTERDIARKYFKFKV